jgi:hypothetical protein
LQAKNQTCNNLSNQLRDRPRIAKKGADAQVGFGVDAHGGEGGIQGVKLRCRRSLAASHCQARKKETEPATLPWPEVALGKLGFNILQIVRQ